MDTSWTAREGMRREVHTIAATSKTTAQPNQPQEFAQRREDEHETHAAPARKNCGAQPAHSVLVNPFAQLASPGCAKRPGGGASETLQSSPARRALLA